MPLYSRINGIALSTFGRSGQIKRHHLILRNRRRIQESDNGRQANAVTQFYRCLYKRRKRKMARPTTKSDLLHAAHGHYQQLNQLIARLTAAELSIPFDFSTDQRKKEAHWQRDKNLRDVLIHLYEWHRLLLGWVETNQNGENKPFIPAPYNWKTYGAMNIVFWQQHQNTPLEKATDMLNQSHQAVLNLAGRFTNDELFTKGAFKWVGGSTLGSYFISATSSHYDWARKKLIAHQKNGCHR